MEYQDKFSSIRKILLEDWDPIDVANDAEARDEYDRYVPQILRLLEARATVEDVARYLGDIVELEMGLVAVKTRDRVAAERLVLLRLK